MAKKIFPQLLILVWILILCTNPSYSQKSLELGITSGAIRFYPHAEFIHHNLNNNVENGSGWSAGLFLEKSWKTRIHPIIELNYYSLASNIFLQKNTIIAPGGYGGNGQQPIFINLDDEHFNQLAISGGIKLYAGKRFFFYPGFEFSLSNKKPVKLNDLNPYRGGWQISNPFILKEEYTHRITSNLKLGFGVHLNFADLVLQYSHGLNKQLFFYDFEAPMGFAKQDNCLQFKVQVPLLKINKTPNP